MGSKVQDLFSEYGRTGIIVYFTIFFATLLGFWLLLTVGVDIRTWSYFSKLGDVGAIGLAYAATKITQPVRIAITLVLTPIVARKFPSKKTSSTTSEEDESSPQKEEAPTTTEEEESSNV